MSDASTVAVDPPRTLSRPRVGAPPNPGRLSRESSSLVEQFDLRIRVLPLVFSLVDIPEPCPLIREIAGGVSLADRSLFAVSHASRSVLSSTSPSVPLLPHKALSVSSNPPPSFNREQETYHDFQRTTSTREKVGPKASPF